MGDVSEKCLCDHNSTLNVPYCNKVALLYNNHGNLPIMPVEYMGIFTFYVIVCPCNCDATLFALLYMLRWMNYYYAY